jgi:hypothetical protein
MQPAKPALQGALAGQVRRFSALGQAYADVAGSPGRMLLAECHGRSVERVLLGRGAAGSRLVAGGETLGLAGEALQQLADRPRAKLQGAGDGCSGLAAARPLEDEAAQGQGEWRRHGNPRTRDSGMRLTYSSATARQNLCYRIHGVTYCRATGVSTPWIRGTPRALTRPARHSFTIGQASSSNRGEGSERQRETASKKPGGATHPEA